MQMHQIRYFLALCEERNFTRAAKRSGVSQPSLTNGIITLERELGGALFQRKPTIALTALGYAMQPYLARIAENADHAQRAAEALGYTDVPRVRPLRLEGCGHFIMLDRPDALADAIARFAASPEGEPVANR